MGSYKDVLPSQYGWIHDLARAEIHPDAEEVLQLGKSFDPHQLVEESTIQFLAELREEFSRFVKIFNGYSEKGGQFAEAKIYSVAQTSADFMVYRNQIKLVVSNVAHGVVQIAFAQHVRGALGLSDDSRSSSAQSQELTAQVGPFRDVYWTFEGQQVSAEQVAKFYFAEFIRATRDHDRSRGGSNQLILDQVKALLKEKGLDL